jgi:hypothetical protein
MAPAAGHYPIIQAAAIHNYRGRAGADDEAQDRIIGHDAYSGASDQ